MQTAREKELETLSFSKFNETNCYLYIICFVLPLVFWNRLQDVDNTPKLFVLSLFLTVFSVYFFINRKKDKWNILMLLAKHPVYIICLLFLGINFFSMSKAINITDGLFTLLNFLLCFIHLNFLVVLLYSEKNAITKVAFGITGAAFVLICIGIYQILVTYYFLMPSQKFEFNYFIGSSVGNKNTFTECLFICLPFSLLTFVNFGGIIRSFALLVFVLSLVLIALLQTVSVLLGLFIFIFSVFVTLFISKRFKKIWIDNSKLTLSIKPVYAIMMAVLVSGIVVVFISTQTFQITEKIKQISQLFKNDSNDDADKNINSIIERKILWTASSKMILEHPLSGVGLDNWKINFPRYNSSHSMLFSSGLIKFEYPHNDYLQTASESGIAGLILFIALFSVPVVVLIKAIKKSSNIREKRNLMLILLSVLSIAFVSFFGYTMQRLMCIFLYLTILALVIVSTKKHNSFNSVGRNYFKLFTLLIFLISVYTLNASWSKLNSEYYLGKTISHQNGKNYARMLKESEKIKTDYFEIDALTTPVEWYKATALFINGNIAAAKERYLLAEKNNPYHIQILTDIGTCYDKTGKPDSAIYYYQKALELLPEFTEAAYNLTAVYFNEGKISDAYNALKKIENRERLKTRYGEYLNAILAALRDNAILKTENDSTQSLEIKNKMDTYYLLKLDSQATNANSIQELLNGAIMGLSGRK